MGFDRDPGGHRTLAGVSAGRKSPTTNGFYGALVQAHAEPLDDSNTHGAAIGADENLKDELSLQLHFPGFTGVKRLRAVDASDRGNGVVVRAVVITVARAGSVPIPHYVTVTLSKTVTTSTTDRIRVGGHPGQAEMRHGGDACGCIRVKDGRWGGECWLVIVG